MHRERLLMRESRRRPWLDRLAMRAAGEKQLVEPANAPRERGDPGAEPTMTRGDALKGIAAVGALALVPLRWTDVAEAKKDCFEPCLGIVEAASQRHLRRCKPEASDFFFGAIPSQLWCITDNSQIAAKYRRQCFKPDCGSLGDIIREGGKLGNFPVAPLEPPPGTGTECENCRSVGGYCGVCPSGTPANPTGKAGFFCGTPPVLPCRYCGGC
jgi:hypothetical protein